MRIPFSGYQFATDQCLRTSKLAPKAEPSTPTMIMTAAVYNTLMKQAWSPDYISPPTSHCRKPWRDYLTTGVASNQTFELLINKAADFGHSMCTCAHSYQHANHEATHALPWQVSVNERFFDLPSLTAIR